MVLNSALNRQSSSMTLVGPLRRAGAPVGSSWRRFTDVGYAVHAYGYEFDGTGRDAGTCGS
jgi:hypothetical protein